MSKDQDGSPCLTGAADIGSTCYRSTRRGSHVDRAVTRSSAVFRSHIWPQPGPSVTPRLSRRRPAVVARLERSATHRPHEESTTHSSTGTRPRVGRRCGGHWQLRRPLATSSLQCGKADHGRNHHRRPATILWLRGGVRQPDTVAQGYLTATTSSSVPTSLAPATRHCRVSCHTPCHADDHPNASSGAALGAGGRRTALPARCGGMAARRPGFRSSRARPTRAGRLQDC
jgi:hypothetical protein